MADGQLAEHPPDDAVEVVASGQVGQKDGVLLLYRGPVGPVHARIVKIVAVNPPCLIEHLSPLGCRVDTDFDGRSSISLAGRRRAVSRSTIDVFIGWRKDERLLALRARR